MSIPELIKLFTNKNALVAMLKKEAPKALDTLVAEIAEQAGAQPGEPVIVALFKANTATGPTTMARVSRVDEFGTVGEEVGTIDIPAALEAVPSERITKMLP